MTQKEHERLSVIRKMLKRELRQKDAAEKLAGKERIRVSDEKLRQIMIEAGL